MKSKNLKAKCLRTLENADQNAYNYLKGGYCVSGRTFEKNFRMVEK